MRRNRDFLGFERHCQPLRKCRAPSFIRLGSLSYRATVSKPFPLLPSSPQILKFNPLTYTCQSRETAAEENPASYFPLLDRVADGVFDDSVTDKEVYDRFLQVVIEDGHLATPESLSSFKLSLSIRSASPRVAAHYQFYNTSVQHSLMAAQDAACPVWVHSDGKQYCSSTMERAQQDVYGEAYVVLYLVGVGFGSIDC